MPWTPTALGTPPGSLSFATAFGTSSNGNIIVGSTDFNGDDAGIAYSWTFSGGYVNLGNLPGGTNPTPQSVANDISDDGSIIVGNSSGGAAGGPYPPLGEYNVEAFIYSGGTMSPLGFLAGGDASQAKKISGDKSIIVGASQKTLEITGPTYPCYWPVAGGGPFELPIGGGDLGGFANGVSHDGSVIVGSRLDSGSIFQPCYWVSGGSPIDIPYPSMDYVTGRCFDVSADGTIITGDMSNGTFQAFVFNVTTSTLTLLGFPFVQTSSSAIAISDDGTRVVGSGTGNFGQPGMGWLWTASDGFINLPPTTGLSFAQPLAISADGSTVAGDVGFSIASAYWRSTAVGVLNVDGLIRKALVAIGSFACGPIPVFPTLPVGFPVKISPNMDTTIGTTKSLREMRVAQRQFPLWDFELAFQELKDETQNQSPYVPFTGLKQYQQLVQLFLSMYGQTGVFAFDAPWDNSRAGQPMGIGNGTQTGFVIYRVWGLGSEAVLAPIGLINQVFEVKVDGVVVPSSGYSVDRNMIFFSVPPANGKEITMTFSYYYLCRFVEDEQDFEEFAKNRWAVPSLKIQAIYWP